MTAAGYRRALGLAFAFAFVLGAVGGCASLGVQPWERGILSQPGMTPGEDVVMSALDEHIYFSKEASTGGLGSGGGGCGCN
jgi:hypothetical protein